MKVTTIVLAAGKGTRLGGPKALLCWPLLPQKWIVPLAAAHVEARRESRRIFVVGRAEVLAVLKQVAPLSFTPPGKGILVPSEAPDDLGPAGSLAAVVDRLEDPDEAVLVTPCDCPPGQPQVVAALLDALAEAPAAKPRYEGRGGHPVAMRASVLARYRQADPPPLRDVLRATAIASVEVDDPQVRIDIDRPEDLEAWSRRFGGGAVDEVAFFQAPGQPPPS